MDEQTRQPRSRFRRSTELLQKNKGAEGCHVVRSGRPDGIESDSMAEHLGRKWFSANLPDATREQVAALQNRINDAKCANLVIDGVVGKKTYSALGECSAIINGTPSERTVQGNCVEPFSEW
jgi:hypothetical protein